MDGAPPRFSFPWSSGKVRAQSSHCMDRGAREHVDFRQAHFKSLFASLLLTTHRSMLIIWPILKSMWQWNKYFHSGKGSFRLALEVKNPIVNAGDIRDVGLILEIGRFPGGGGGGVLVGPGCPHSPLLPWQRGDWGSFLWPTGGTGRIWSQPVWVQIQTGTFMIT